MIEQIPLINLLILVTTALFMPLIRKFDFRYTKVLGLVSFLAVFILSIISFYDVYTNGMFYYHLGGHAPFIGIEFRIDAFSSFFTLFIGFMMLLYYIYAVRYMFHEIKGKQHNRYYTIVFLLVFASFGLIYTNDLFNTYVFIEIMSITACAIISIVRKKQNYSAAFRYLVLNEIGSLSYLFGVALIYMITGYTNIELVAQALEEGYLLYPANVFIAMAFMVVGLSIKAAIFPLHIWLPDAHSTAPIPSHAILSAVVLKVNLIVLIKLLYRVFGVQILLDLHMNTVLIVFGILSMIMGSFFALAQKDIKRILAYSSVAQVGYIVLGIGFLTELGLYAGLFHIVSHGIMKSTLFLSAGMIIYHTGVRNTKKYQGFVHILPITITLMSIATLSMIGIPGTSGFISKFNLAMASLDENMGYIIIFIVLSGLLNAMYYLPMIITSILDNHESNMMHYEVDKIPKTMLIPVMVLGALILVIGFYPQSITFFIEAATDALIGGV